HFAIETDIEVIPNFVSHFNFKEKKNGSVVTRKKELAPNGEFIISHISNFRKLKRLHDVVSIFNLIHKKVPAKLILAGDGPERFAAEQQCKELGICKDVEFVGNVQSADEILDISDLFLLPSETESFGLAALEALASGVPVISSNSGGLPEVNEQGVSGFLSKVGNVKEMADNALKILATPESLAKFRQQAYEHSLKFSLESILPKYEALYDRVLKKKKEI
ncbi:MAG: glycosyltransferase, partial [Crocinitomicaceae bacterium]|nr:glycosyltransferase [Crocinitomicaceae bacterium]